MQFNKTFIIAQLTAGGMPRADAEAAFAVAGPLAEEIGDITIEKLMALPDARDDVQITILTLDLLGVRIAALKAHTIEIIKSAGVLVTDPDGNDQ